MINRCSSRESYLSNYPNAMRSISMLFIKDINLLPLNQQRFFNPRIFSKNNPIVGNCVYGYLREIDDEFGPKGSLKYIGEGSSSRPLNQHSRHCVVKSHRNIVIFVDDIDKPTGLVLERLLIDCYGRIVNSTGILENKNPGNNIPSKLKLDQIESLLMLCEQVTEINSTRRKNQRKEKNKCISEFNSMMPSTTYSYCTRNYNDECKKYLPHEIDVIFFDYEQSV